MAEGESYYPFSDPKSLDAITLLEQARSAQKIANVSSMVLHTAYEYALNRSKELPQSDENLALAVRITFQALSNLLTERERDLFVVHALGELEGLGVSA